MNQRTDFDIIMDENTDLSKLEKKANIFENFTVQKIRDYLKVNLALLSLELRIKITTFERNNKLIIFFTSIFLSSVALVMTYLNRLFHTRL